MFRHYNLIAPTKEGWAYLALLGGVMFGAVNTGNNLVYIVLGVLLAMLVIANVLAEWNLRGLRVERRLPAEVFAGTPSPGHFVVINPRGSGSAWQVELIELGAVRGKALLERCPPTAAREVPVDWLFPVRGEESLVGVRVQSSFPFGLVRRWRDLPVPGQLLVYPTPNGRPPPARSEGEGDESATRQRAADLGEFAGLRPYRPGDPLRRIHWPSSARAVEPLVVLRTATGTESLVLHLPPNLSGEPREDAIRRLTGTAEAHFQRGDAVGLSADGVELLPSVGASARRTLLAALARLAKR